MTVELKTILPENFNPLSKTWIYQSNRTFTLPELFQAEEILEVFTDSSVHVIKQIELMNSVQMFNRELLAFWVKEKVQTIPLAQVGYALENGILTKDTLYFNNLVANKAAMEKDWLQPISESWLAKKYIK
jgi:hypothetical protein